MKALTICQPFAHLVITPQAELKPGETVKRVENRRWGTDHRGPLVIHAGKSLDYLAPCTPAHFPEMAFGAIVGVVDLVACVWMQLDKNLDPMFPAEAKRLYPWLASHIHTEGPCCWILDNPRRFAKPIPYCGQQRLFEIDDQIITQAFAEEHVTS